MDRRKFIGNIAGGLLAWQKSATAALGSEFGAAGKETGPSPGSLSTAEPALSRPLATLAPNAARNLGPWIEPPAERDSANRAPGQRTDFSGVAYDPIGKRILMRGGHHGINLTTNIRAMDLNPIQFYNIGPNVLLEEMTLANCDASLGRWVNKNAPWSRHTYGGNVVVGNKLVMVAEQNSHQAVGGVTFPNANPTGRSAVYDIATGTWTYSQMGGNRWLINISAVKMHGADKILVLCPDMGSWMRAYIYDPVADTKTALSCSFDPKGWVSEPGLVAYPPNGKYYAVKHDGQVYEITVDPANPAAATAVQVQAAGWPSGPASRFVRCSYDPVNQTVAGSLVAANVVGGERIAPATFVAWKPGAGWKLYTPIVEAGSAGVPHTSFHCAVFDPDSGCYIAFDQNGSCWAYRPPPFETASTGATGAASGLSLALDFGGGKVARFSGGVDAGDFVGEFVRQKCFMATDPAFPDWRVFFRPDADGNREEVVVEYGRGVGGTPTNWLTPYTATIKRDNEVVSTSTVAKHWWDSRWRWQSAPRPVVRPVDVLKERAWIPNFGKAGLFGRRANTYEGQWLGPMTIPRHISVGMGAGGDNSNIGHLSEIAADYAIHGTPVSLKTILVEGEQCGTWNMHTRLADGSMPGIRGGNLQYKGRGAPETSILNEGPRVKDPHFMELAISHWYPSANMAWMLTDDPYYLEELQFGLNWRLLYSSYARLNEKLPGLIDFSQPRSLAWGLRDLFLAASSTPEAVPRWLQPRSTWKGCLDDNLKYAMRYVNSPARVQTLFRVWPRCDMVATWMVSWLNFHVGLGVKQGFAEWKPVFDWGIGQHIAQTNGKSGWNRQMPAPYYWWPLHKPGTLEVDETFRARVYPPIITDSKLDAVTFNSWKEASDAYLQTVWRDVVPKMDISTWDGHTLMGKAESYILHLRATHAMATTLETPEARECYDYLQTEIKWEGQARFSVEP